MKRSSKPRADLHSVLANLSSDSAPDLSRPIMGRLGYMRINPAVARRRRMMKWANRAGMLMMVAVAFSLGWRVFQASPQVRRPADTTIPQALGRDVQVQHERIGSMIQTIRSISAPRTGWFSGTEAGEESPSGDQPGVSEPNPQDLRDDVNRSDAAPVRWV